MFNRNFKIYRITNKENGKSYIGVTKNSLEQRFYHHKKTNSCTILNKAINKYGEEAFSIEVVWQASNLENMINQENYFIQLHQTLVPNGYNLRDGGHYGKFSEFTKQDMSVKGKERWKNPTEKMKSGLNKFLDNPYNEKEPIIGINIYNKDIQKFDSIEDSKEKGFTPSSNLMRKCIHDHDYLWFYDDGFSDQFYIDLAEIQLGGFNNYRKGGKDWDNKEHKKQRIESMIESAKDRAKPLIAVSRFDASILEFPSINDAIKKEYTWGSIRQALIGDCKHAYNYCWFYKENDKNNDYYIQKAEKILGKFNNTNIRPLKAINIKTSENIYFNNIDEVISLGFTTKEVRQVLTGRRKSYKGYIWKFL